MMGIIIVVPSARGTYSRDPIVGRTWQRNLRISRGIDPVVVTKRVKCLPLSLRGLWSVGQVPEW